jgi:hypothetical protein
MNVADELDGAASACPFEGNYYQAARLLSYGSEV